MLFRQKIEGRRKEINQKNFTQGSSTNDVRLFLTPSPPIVTLLSTVKLGYNELGYNEHGYQEYSIVTNKISSPKSPFSTQINPVITNPGYNEQIWSVQSCSL